MVSAKTEGWAIVQNGKFVLFDGRMPIYWLRRVAVMEAERFGFDVSSRTPDVRICRVTVNKVNKVASR